MQKSHKMSGRMKFQLLLKNLRGQQLLFHQVLAALNNVLWTSEASFLEYKGRLTALKTSMTSTQGILENYISSAFPLMTATGFDFINFNMMPEYRDKAFHASTESC